MLRRAVERVTRNWALKLTALVLAVLLWSVVQEVPIDDTVAQDVTTPDAFLRNVPVPDVPVEVVSQDPEWVQVGTPTPATVTLIVSGQARDVVAFARDRPQVVIVVDQVRDSLETRVLDMASVHVDGEATGVRIEEVYPGFAQVPYERFASRRVPVRVPTRGQLAAGLVLASPLRAEPPTVQISGPASAVRRHSSVTVPALDLGGIRQSGTRRAAVDTTGLGDVSIEPREVLVRIQVEPLVAEPFPPPPPAGLDTLVPPPDTIAPPADTLRRSPRTAESG